MACGCEASIQESDPRAPIWRAVFGKTSCPIVVPPLHGSNPYFPGRRFLQGDSAALTPEQKETMATLLSGKFGISAVEILQDLNDGQFPILDDHVTVSFCKLHSRFLR